MDQLHFIVLGKTIGAVSKRLSHLPHISGSDYILTRHSPIDAAKLANVFLKKKRAKHFELCLSGSCSSERGCSFRVIDSQARTIASCLVHDYYPDSCQHIHKGSETKNMEDNCAVEAKISKNSFRGYFSATFRQSTQQLVENVNNPQFLPIAIV